MPARPEARSFLVITADDFGLRDEVNEAVEQANLNGVLTAASLMVGAPAAADAIRRARLLPNLRVGLHVVLADGMATLPPSEVPGLTDRSGRMSAEMVLRGVRYFAVPAVRRQLEAEVRAQFDSFARTGLMLDHVNVHKHYQFHPTILGLLLKIGKEYGAPPFRVPCEPAWFASLSGGGWGRINRLLLLPWSRLMQGRIDAAGARRNDQIFGIAASGAMNEARILRALESLPPGITEIYLHPATDSGGASELAALLSPRVRDALAGMGVPRGGYRDALAARRIDCP